MDNYVFNRAIHFECPGIPSTVLDFLVEQNITLNIEIVDDEHADEGPYYFMYCNLLNADDKLEERAHNLLSYEDYGWILTSLEGLKYCELPSNVTEEDLYEIANGYMKFLRKQNDQLKVQCSIHTNILMDKLGGY